MRFIFKVLLPAAIITMISAIPAASANAGPQRNCDKRMEKQTLDQPEPKDWDSLYRLFKQFGACDNGATSDRFSRDVAQVLSKQWNHLDALSRLAAADRAFEQFILRHIDTSLDEDELLSIADNSKSHCPPGEDACLQFASRKGAEKSRRPARRLRVAFSQNSCGQYGGTAVFVVPASRRQIANCVAAVI